jgi:hypothetical protein
MCPWFDSWRYHRKTPDATLGVFILTSYCKNITGTLAQLVEQWTENPCVPGSIPGGTTQNKHKPLIIRERFSRVLSFIKKSHNKKD